MESEQRSHWNRIEPLISTAKYESLAVIARTHNISSIILYKSDNSGNNSGNIAWRIGSNIYLWDGKAHIFNLGG